MFEKIDAAILCVAALLCAFLPSLVAADDALVRVTDGAYPPFVEIGGNGEPTGLDRQVAEAVCREIVRTCEFVIAPWDRLVSGLRAGQFDVAFSGLTEATVTAAELAPSQPYFMASARFLVLQETSGAVSLNGGTATIGVLAGTPHATYLEAQINDAEMSRRSISAFSAERWMRYSVTA